MEGREMKNKRILNVSLRDNYYAIEVSLSNQYINEVEDIYFTLSHRYGDEEINLTVSSINYIESFTVFSLEFSFDMYQDLFLVCDIWDLNVFLRKEKEIKKARIKSNRDYLRFYAIVLPESEKIFYPYTTRKGNVSFRLNEYHLFGMLEEVYFKGEKLYFSGFFNYPPLLQTDEYRLLDVKMIVTNNLNESEIEFPLKEVKRPDLDEKYIGNENMDNTGFHGFFDVLNHVNFDQNEYFKFYLELSLEHNGIKKVIRSVRLRYSRLTNSVQSKVIRYHPYKLKIKYKPTKKSKYLSLKVSDYKFKREVINNIRTKWVKIRRSRFLLKLYKIAFAVLGKIPVRKNLIMFESFLGKQYSDSPRAIYEYLLEYYPNYKMYWSADRRHLSIFENKDVKYIRRFSIKWLFLMARSEYWVSNSRLPLWIPKPSHTSYLQTWHGTPLKRLAADMDEVHMPGTNAQKYKQNFLNAVNKWDYLVSPNAYSTEIFRRAFQFNGTMIESGYPRNDFLLNDNNEATISDLKEANNLPRDKKVILYAPTWRDNQFYEKGKYKFNLRMDIALMKEELGDEYIILLRLHYLVAENIDLSTYEGFAYDFSKHEDIRELYMVADLLITDYSSVFFDYANLKRPMLFYVYDIEDYRDNLRGFYFDLESKAPGPLVKTTEQIINEVKKIEQNGFEPSQTTEEFYKKFCYLEDGNASKRVVDKVF
ncbi:CDP-glycerol glycerophosphotransferase family protein [Lentibacillus salinarum]|uniref:CDP-glycerol glycerophosphotransferase family protein n=1 Tax=Lentibacillus salinarum TaxID=446820 RepID=A0ABW3ZZL6_9BACI